MSIQVEPDELGDALRVYRFAYLITVGANLRSHAVAVVPTLDGRTLTVDGLGRRSLANLVDNPAVTLLWPPQEPDGYSLIVDGQAETYPSPSGGRDVGPTDESEVSESEVNESGVGVRVTVARAVLHRPAPGARTAPDATEAGCVADCVEIPVASSTR